LARQYQEEAVALARQLGNKRDVAAALNNLGQIHRVDGKLDEAGALYDQVLAVAREIGDYEILGISLLNLAMVRILARTQGSIPPLLREALAIVEKTGSRPIGQSVLEVCAGYAAFRKEPARTARFFGAANAQMSQTSLQRDAGDELFLAPMIEQARHDMGSPGFEAAEAAGRSLTYEAAMLEVRAWLETMSG
jgi:hypothetical protein